MTISTFIPTYATPKRLESLARSLSAESCPDSEIVIVVDGATTPEIGAALESVRSLPRVRIVEGNPHLGKAAALNRAVAGSDASLLVFIDNDVLVAPGVALFEGCIRMLESSDIGELPKTGLGRGPVAAMMKLEFLANLAGTRVVVNRTGRCPSMNGAAFAVRRELFLELGGFAAVVNEDLDFSARAFLAGARFGLDPSLRVLNEVPETPAAWFRQRRRWAVSLGVWNDTYLARFRKDAPGATSGLVLSSMVFPLPFVAAVAAIAAAIVGYGLSGPGIPGFLIGLSGLSLYAFSALYFAREAKYFMQPFSLVAFVVYSLVYLPIWGISSLTGILIAKTRGVPEMDWKYSNSKPIARQVRFPVRVARSAKTRAKSVPE
ncbi:MAG: glycosyltransferase family 2 protein [Rectinemataceae bacterium]